MVKKLKAHTRSPHKRGVIRQVQCGGCGWLVAAPHAGALLASGWATAFERGLWAFICRTCAREHPRRVATMPDVEQRFRGLPAAPADAYPCIGMEGEQHEQTSRPIEVEVRHLRT